jgi:pimeloyl-ACP methyl ester carboxylesterase
VKKLFVLLFALGVFYVPCAAQSKAGELKLEPITFEAPNQKPVGAERGWLTVPENRQNPNSRLIQITFARFPSTAAKPGAPIVYLAGGPGGSGIGAAQSGRFPLFMALREVADVIALDQRGTGQAKPTLPCVARLDAPLDKPGDAAEILRQMQEKSAACADYWRAQGADLAGYNTNESADDLADLRRALGAPKISLWGISYGTHLALATLKRHGAIIDRAILAGVEGPDHTYKLPSNLQLQLEAIAREVKADPTLSRQIPDFPALVKSVFDALDQKPAEAEVTDPQTKQKVKLVIGKFDLQWLTASGMGDAGAIRQLPAAFYEMSRGDFSRLAPFLLSARRRGLGSAMPFMMDCASGATPQRLARIAREEKTALLGATIDFPFPGVCSAWGNPDAGPQFRAPVKTNVPTLFISGTLDGRTPPSNAEEVRQGFANSHHLIIERAAHSDDLFLSSPQILTAMKAFLQGEKNLTPRISLPPLQWATINKYSFPK